MYLSGSKTGLTDSSSFSKNRSREDNKPQSTLIDETFKTRFIV